MPDNERGLSSKEKLLWRRAFKSGTSEETSKQVTILFFDHLTKDSTIAEYYRSLSHDVAEELSHEVSLVLSKALVDRLYGWLIEKNRLRPLRNLRQPTKAELRQIYDRLVGDYHRPFVRKLLEEKKKIEAR